MAATPAIATIATNRPEATNALNEEVLRKLKEAGVQGTVKAQRP